MNIILDNYYYRYNNDLQKELFNGQCFDELYQFLYSVPICINNDKIHLDDTIFSIIDYKFQTLILDTNKIFKYIEIMQNKIKEELISVKLTDNYSSILFSVLEYKRGIPIILTMTILPYWISYG